MKTKVYDITCGRCKRLFYSFSVAKCPHPTVNKYFGQHICIYCCSKCKHHIKFEHHGGVACGYNGGDNNG